jgi:rfaE bifunctional protein kinase chain/domain
MRAMRKPSVLVVGDAMLDRCWDGAVHRLSPEAAVPVLRVTRRDERAGGAANVALNLAALGVSVTLLALVGEDAAGASLGGLLAEAGVAWLPVSDPAYATTEKIRCVSGRQPMLRADLEMTPPPAMRAALAERFAQALPAHDMLLLSDYGKGALDDCAPLVAAAREAGRPVLVDPKGQDWSRYAGATLLKPNRAELLAVLGEGEGAIDRDPRVDALRRRLGVRHVVVTRDADGMTLFDDAGVAHEPARVREALDVGGAGDTAMAALAWRLAEGDDCAAALRWASVAAGLAVQQFGTAVVGREAVVAAMSASG